MATQYTIKPYPGRAKPAAGPRLKPISDTRHAGDAGCPDAAWKALSREQKARLSILAAKAYQAQQVQGMTVDEWRREVSIRACGMRISEATNAQWADLKSAFLSLAGKPEQAFETQLREADNKRRIAMHKLTTACRERGLHVSYPGSICHAQFKVPLAEASAKQLWCLFYTVTNRRKAKP